MAESASSESLECWTNRCDVLALQEAVNHKGRQEQDAPVPPSP
jgi:hypothetical protein